MVQVVSRGVVGRADPDELGVLVARLQNTVGFDVETVVERNRPILDVVDGSTHLIHAICGFYGHHVVDARLAEASIGKVYGLVATVAEANLLFFHAFNACYDLLQVNLQGVRIAV